MLAQDIWFYIGEDSLYDTNKFYTCIDIRVDTELENDLMNTFRTPYPWGANIKCSQGD